MSRKPLVLLVLLLALLPAAVQALQFAPASPIGLPAHAPVTHVAVSASAPQVVYASTAGGKLYRSTDAGETWVALTVPSPTVDFLAVDPADSSILYIVSWRHTYRSDDGGATWKDLSAKLGVVSVKSLRIDPQAPSTIYIGSCTGIFPEVPSGGVHKSTDRGETWSLDRSMKCVSSLALDPASPQRLFAAAQAGEYRTENAGRTWQKASSGLPVYDVVADPLDPSRRYGLGLGTLATGYLHFLVSTNAGATWSRQHAEGLPNGGQQLIIEPQTRRLFLLGQSVGLFVSDDLGLHWRRIDAVPSVPATSLTMAAAGGVIYVATSRGLYRVPMSDPDSPTVIHLGDPTPLRVGVDRIAVDPTDATTLYATAYEGHGILNAYRVFRSTDAGATWERITSEEDRARRVEIAVDAAGDLYAVDKQTLWRFAKATQTWETWTVPEILGPTTFLANPVRPGWLYSANSGRAWYSTDGGRTWTRIENPGGGFWSLSIAPNGSDLVGGNNDGAFASSDGGVTWRALATGRFETRVVALAPSRPATIYRLTNPANGRQTSALYRSDDGGETWTALRWPGERDYAPPIAVDPRDPRSVWIGLAHSTDGGETWTIEPSNTPVAIRTVAFNRDGTLLYGLAVDSSVWRANVEGSRRRAVRR